MAGRPSHPWEGWFSVAASPQQYTGCEWNSSTGVEGGPSVTLAFPDSYELGMSNFGLSVVRHLLLASGMFSVRRAFCPGRDMYLAAISHGLPWVTVEDGRPVGLSDVLAFGIPCEILYPNVLMLLSLAGLPLRSSDRRDGPLVVAGGGGLSNPLPLAPFVDAFFLGEAECGAVDLFAALTGPGGRTERLEAASRLPGVWVPALGRRPVEYRRCAALDPADAPVRQVVPLARISHDRAVVEIARGCTRGCRFCQATNLARPVRERPVEDVGMLLRRSLLATGWEDAGLLSLSFSDYSRMDELLETLARIEGETGVNISRPSLRPDTFARAAAAGRIEGRVTMAPEAGRESMRTRLNKDLTDAQVLEAVGLAFRMGATGVKLYFMIGLPGETDDDIAAISDLASRAAGAARSSGRPGRASVSVALSPFIPKPHTPLQWSAQQPVAESERRIGLVRAAGRRYTTTWNDPSMSLLEAVLSQGDDIDTPSLLEEAVRLGAGFESWKEHFRRDVWSGLLSSRPRTASFVQTPRDPSEDPPWAFVDTGVSLSWLRRELERFEDGILTGDCRLDGCSGCGACGGTPTASPDSPPAAVDLPARRRGGDVTATLRMRFSRTGLARFSSQLDIVRLWMRVARRSGLPVAFTSGHVTRPRLRFGPALPLGFESESEYVDILLSDGGGFEAADISGSLPPGFGLTGARLVAGRVPSPESESSVAEYAIFPEAQPSGAARMLEDLPGTRSLGLVDRCILLTADLGSPAARPDRALAGFGEFGGVLVRRIGISGVRGGDLLPLLELHEGVDLV